MHFLGQKYFFTNNNIATGETSGASSISKVHFFGYFIFFPQPPYHQAQHLSLDKKCPSLEIHIICQQRGVWKTLEIFWGILEFEWNPEIVLRGNSFQVQRVPPTSQVPQPTCFMLHGSWGTWLPTYLKHANCLVSRMCSMQQQLHCLGGTACASALQQQQLCSVGEWAGLCSIVALLQQHAVTDDPDGVSCACASTQPPTLCSRRCIAARPPMHWPDRKEEVEWQCSAADRRMYNQGLSAAVSGSALEAWEWSSLMMWV